MGEIRRVDPVKLFCGLISAGEEPLQEAQSRLVAAYGELDCESGILPFTFTDYYEKEMGQGLVRKFISFRKLVDPAAIADIKLATNAIEQSLAHVAGAGVSRKVNLDPGYVTPAQLVLATTKPFSHRIYLGKSIYAEVTLIFRKAGMVYFDWTYPDFKSGAYDTFFYDVRRILMEQL